MSISAFIPEVWSSALLVALRKKLIYAGPGVVNRNYEGEIAQSGDTVRITSISRPTVGNYVPGSTTIVPEQLVDAQRTLTIDQVKYWAFQVDDVDQRQAQGDVIPQATNEAAYALADVMDQHVASLYTQANAANQLGTVSVTTGAPDAFYENVLVPLAVKLDEANVPREGRWVVVPPWLHGRGLLDDRFIRVNESGSDETLRNGIVGRSAGFDILVSNNSPLVTGDDYAVIAGNDTAITFAEQINKTEAYRPESSFSDAVKGLAMWGAKVIRPEALATAVVSQT